MRALATLVLLVALVALAFAPTGDPVTPIRWGLILLAAALAAAAGVLFSGARYTTPVNRREWMVREVAAGRMSINEARALDGLPPFESEAR